jgi:ankyrin repeat protein
VFNGLIRRETILSALQEELPVVHYCARDGDAKQLQEMIDRSPKDVHRRGSGCHMKMTPLMLAAREGHVDCVRVLLKHEPEMQVRTQLRTYVL